LTHPGGCVLHNASRRSPYAAIPLLPAAGTSPAIAFVHSGTTPVRESNPRGGTNTRLSRGWVPFAGLSICRAKVVACERAIVPNPPRDRPKRPRQRHPRAQEESRDHVSLQHSSAISFNASQPAGVGPQPVVPRFSRARLNLDDSASAEYRGAASSPRCNFDPHEAVHTAAHTRRQRDVKSARCSPMMTVTRPPEGDFDRGRGAFFSAASHGDAHSNLTGVPID